MDFRLEKRTDLPYYVQLKNILKTKIQSGEHKGKKLPPVRQIARDNGVSVNTVLRAYNELQREGVVTGSVGKGTFITATADELEKDNRKALIKKLIEHTLEEALSLEYSLEEFEDEVKSYINEKRAMLQKVKIVFIECNIEQVLYFTDHLELDPHIHRVPVVLEDLNKQNKETMQEIADSDLILTSFYHLNEVHEHLNHLGKPIIGINLEPEVKTIIEIAKVPSDNTVGIVTTSKRFIKIIKDILEELNLDFLKILESNSNRDETIKRIVRKCDAVLVSPKRKQIVSNYSKDNTKVIEFCFTPDRTSINNLKVALLELKKV